MASVRRPKQSEDRKQQPAPVPAQARTGEAASVSVSQAKTHLLALLTEIESGKKAVTITRRGRPVAQIVPMATPKLPSGLGCMKGTFTMTGDVVSPDPEAWGPSSVWGASS